MRILHTSDWHLGRLFHRASLLDEQAQALARIVELTRTERVELVIIAGDLYDRSVPPADAVELFDQTLLELHRAGATVVAISGNHDSAVRVGYGDRLMEQLGVSVRGDLRRIGEAIELTPPDGGEPVRVYPVPFLDPLAASHHARGELAAGSSSRDSDDSDSSSDDSVDGPAARARFTHHDAMAWAMDRVRADLTAHPGARSVVVAHTFLTGGDPSASERELSLGHVDQVGMSVFDGIDYVALGHLHQRQAFDGGRVAYSGSPLRYSFSEASNVASVRLIDLAADGSLTIEQIPLGVGRDLHTISGELDELLADPSLAAAESGWVRVVLTDRQLPLQAMRRLQERFPHAVELSHEPAGTLDGERSARTGAEVRVADPLELSLEFLRDRRGLDVDDAERAVLGQAISAVRTGSAP
ncbi:MAG: exonuclease SbcCD subunit D [Microthrixaceae bacterium]